MPHKPMLGVVRIVALSIPWVGLCSVIVAFPRHTLVV